MALEVHVLGTSSARPAQGRSVSGSIVETAEGMLVVDCGEGFQNRLVTHRSQMKSHGGRRLKMSRVAAILLTHGHLDHTWGVLPWMQTMALDGRKDKLWVIGPTTSEVVEALLGSEVEPEVNPSDLVIQYDMWIDLGANSETLGYEVEWILGDGERWVNMNDERVNTSPFAYLDMLVQGAQKISVYSIRDSAARIARQYNTRRDSPSVWLCDAIGPKGQYFSDNSISASRYRIFEKHRAR